MTMETELQMEGVILILESQATDRLVREPHLDHGSQEGACTASEPTGLLATAARTPSPRGRRDGDQASLGLRHPAHNICSLLYPTFCKSGCIMEKAFNALILYKTFRYIFESWFLQVTCQAPVSTAGEGLAG